MVSFKKTQEGTVTIFEGKDKTKEGTTLLVRPPLTGPERILVSLQENLPQLSNWSTQIRYKLSHSGDTSIVQDPDFKALVLLSSTHDDSATPNPFTLLGHRIRAGEVQWNTLKGIGELPFVVGYWEWTENILSRHGTFLKGMRMYDAVFASLFTYDRHPSVLRAFLECWCSSTNSMHTSIGEVSISLWDLQIIGGLPIAGQFYDEVVPSAKEFSSKNPDGSPALPPTCQYLFLAYHRLCKGSKGVVKISAWVDFWFKGASKHEKPVKKAKWNKTMRQEDTFNPSGKIPSIQARKASEEEVFDRLGIEKTLQEKTYLAAFLAAWLCKFMLPLENATVMRPGVFRIASKMAKGEVFCLAAPVLASIYRGLNETISSSDPATGNVVFPAHYLYGWLAEYFRTHFCTPGELNRPLMVKYSGQGGARHFDDLEVQALFRSCKGVVLHHLAMKLPQRERRVDDSPSPNVHNLEYLISIRSCYLTLRCEGYLVIEPYAPHRFSRQFGFQQHLPGKLKKDVRDGTLSDVMNHWRSYKRYNTGAAVTLPGRDNLRKFSITKAYDDWWLKVYSDPFSNDSGALKSKKRAVSPRDSSSKVQRRKPNSHDSGTLHRRQQLETPKRAEVEDRLSSERNSDRCWKHIARDKDKSLPPANPLTVAGTPLDGFRSSSQPHLCEEQKYSNLEATDEPQGSNDSIQGPSSLDLAIKMGQQKKKMDEITSTTPHLSAGDGPSHFPLSSFGKGVTPPSSNPVSRRAAPSIVTMFDTGSTILSARCIAALVLDDKIKSVLGKTPFEKVASLRPKLQEIYDELSTLQLDYSPLQTQIEKYIQHVADYVSMKTNFASGITMEEKARRLGGVDQHLTDAQALNGQATQRAQTFRFELNGIDAKRAKLKRELGLLDLQAKKLKELIDGVDAERVQNEQAITTLQAERATVEATEVMERADMEVTYNLERLLKSEQEDIQNLAWLP